MGQHRRRRLRPQGRPSRRRHLRHLAQQLPRLLCLQPHRQPRCALPDLRGDHEHDGCLHGIGGLHRQGGGDFTRLRDELPRQPGPRRSWRGRVEVVEPLPRLRHRHRRRLLQLRLVVVPEVRRQARRLRHLRRPVPLRPALDASEVHEHLPRPLVDRRQRLRCDVDRRLPVHITGEDGEA